MKRLTGSPLLIGDRVRFTAQFLRSIVQYTGPEAPTSVGPFARGEIVSESATLPQIVFVRWDNGKEGGVHRENLEREDAPCL